MTADRGLFEPTELGPVRLRDRIVKAATFENAAPGGLVSDRLVDFHREVAAGGAGLTTVAYCAVEPDGLTYRDQLVLTVDTASEAVPGLRRLTDAVHSEGAAAALQLGHAGWFANPRVTASRPLGPSATISPHAMARSRAATHRDLAALLGRFRDAVALAAVRDAAGGSVAVTAKLNMDDGFARGLTLDDGVEVARMLEADGTLDALQLTGGFTGRTPMHLMRGDDPLPRLADEQRSLLTRLGMKAVTRFWWTTTRSPRRSSSRERLRAVQPVRGRDGARRDPLRLPRRLGRTLTHPVDDVLHDDDEVRPYVIEVDGTPGGYVQWTEEIDPSGSRVDASRPRTVPGGTRC